MPTYIASVTLVIGFLMGVITAAPSESYGSRMQTAKPAQYQSQDALSGAYQYGYTGPHHAKSESSVNGVTRGGYSYIDSNGQLQTVSYTADALNGFRVHASNLPNRNTLVPVQDTPEVALAKKRHLDQLRRAESTSSSWQQQQQQQQQEVQQQQQSFEQPRQPQRYQQRSKSRHLFLLDPAEIHGIPAPRPSNAIVVDAKDIPPPRGFAVSSSSHHVLVPAASVIVPVMPVIHTSMRHSQDTMGQYEYSYTGDTSAKTESRSLDGTTRGAYSYIDANGLLQQVHYIADKDGFRVLATNLPGA